MSIITDHVHIVFGDEHYNPLGLIRSLGEYGIKPIAIIIKKNSSFASKSKYLSKVIFVNDIEDGYRVLIERFGKSKLKDFVYTSDDAKTSYLDKHYEELKNRFYFYNCGEQGRLSTYMDKDNINKIAEKCGIKVPHAIRVKTGIIPDGVEYPIITKAIDSLGYGWKNDVFVCNNQKALEEAYKHISSKEVLLQKYVNKKNELCIDGFSAHRGKVVYNAIASTYKYILPDRYSTYMDVQPLLNKSVNQKIKNVFAETGFEGIYSFEFLVDQNDELFFLEVNFRNSGWSYASTVAGMPLPILWAKAMVQEGNVEEPIEFDSFTSIVEPADFKNRVLHLKMNPFSWFVQLCKCKCKFYIGRYDIMPLLSLLKGSK